MKRRDLLLLWGYSLPVVAISVLPISYEADQSLNEINIVFFRLDYLLHTAIFLIWGLVAGLCIIKVSENKQKSIIVFGLIGILLAVLTELIQKFLPYRGYNVYDMIGNVLGVLLSFGFWMIILKKKRIGD
jgi:VanZ family protein